MSSSRHLARFCLALFAAALTLDQAAAQDESKRYKTGEIHVGDHIQASATSNGSPENCVVTAIRPDSRQGYDGDFLLNCEHGYPSSVPASGDHARLVSRGSAADAAKPPPRPYYLDPPAPAAATAVGRPAMPNPRPHVTAPTTQPQRTVAAPAAPGGNAFGSRNPRTCPNITSRPSSGQAAQLVACAREQDSRQNLEWLVDSVVVTSMTGSRYDPHTQTGFTNMDTTVAPIAIAGSLVSWQCTPQDGPAVMARYSNVGKNCSRTTENPASGYCYKLRTGAWNCTMQDTTTPYPKKDTRSGLPPPR